MLALLLAAGAVATVGGLVNHGQMDASTQLRPSGSEVYVEELPGIRTGATDRAHRASNTAILNHHLALGEHLHLHAGTRIEISGTLKVRSGGAIIGDEGAETPTIYLPADGFDYSSDGPVGRYGRNAAGIDFSGEQDGGFRPSANVRLENLKLVSEQRTGRRLRGIVGRNVTGCLIRNVEIANFPLAVGIALASASRCHITGVSIHDFWDDTPWRTLPQSTGIEIDNDTVHGIPSLDDTIDHFRIERLRVGGPLLARWGYQTDGINLLTTVLRTRITDGEISDVGEGIDTFGSDGTITRVTIRNAYIFGVKFIHGATNNRGDNLTILNAGLAGVIFDGSDQITRNSSGNVITDIRIMGIDPAAAWKGHSTAGILVSGRNTTGLPVNNRVVNGQIDLGSNGNYGWLDDSKGCGNQGIRLTISGGSANGRPVLILHHGSSVEFRSKPG